MRTRLPQRDFNISKVPVPTYQHFTVGSRCRYFCQKPVVPENTPTTILQRTFTISANCLNSQDLKKGIFLKIQMFVEVMYKVSKRVGTKGK